MFFALTRSSTSKRTSIGTPNSNRSLMIRSTRSRVFIWSVGAALCFLPRGVGQLLNMTSSMILGGGNGTGHGGQFWNKELRCLLSILQPASVFSNITNFSRHLGGRGRGRSVKKYTNKGPPVACRLYLIHKFDHFGLSLRLGDHLLRLLHHLKVILRHP